MDGIIIGATRYLDEGSIQRAAATLSSLIDELGKAQKGARDLQGLLQVVTGTRGYQFTQGDACLLHEHASAVEMGVKNTEVTLRGLKNLLDSLRKAAEEEDRVHALLKGLEANNNVRIS